MTKEELKIKLDASQEKVDKRLNLITKTCNKLDLDANSILEKFKEIKDYMSYTQLEKALDIETEDVDDYRDAEGNWTEKCEEVDERNSKILSLLDSLYKLKELEQVRDNWKAKYDAKVAEDNVEKVAVIWDFLTEWESKCIEWYKNNAKRYFELSQTFPEDYEQYKMEYDETHVKPDDSDYSAKKRYDNFRRAYLNQYKENYFSTIPALTREITHIQYDYKDGRRGEALNYRIDEEKLNKVISQEKERKYKDLVARVQSVVGTITNAANLHIGNQNGELNGYIEGTNGKCSVETISAGGYNIQCFHYRVLIHKL